MLELDYKNYCICKMLTPKKQPLLKYIEVAILVLIWLVVFLSPLIAQNNLNEIDWRGLRVRSIKLLPFLLLVLVNHFLLVPFLLLKKKRLWYFISLVIITITFSYTLYFQADRQTLVRNSSIVSEEYRPNLPFEKQQPISKYSNRQMSLKNSQESLHPTLNVMLFILLIIGFDTGLMTFFRQFKTEQEQLYIEKENITSQLVFLKTQVNPHFFMNTLNNIHALININTDEAKEAIIHLSQLMRHLLYDTEKKDSSIKKEIQFIQAYIDLMKLRYSKKVTIDLELPDKLPEKNIPSLLFTPLLENAFKHGISYQKESFIHISFSFEHDYLYFSIRNSKAKSQEITSTSGIGIENIRKRLNLVYKNNYDLDIINMKNEFIVKLSIPL